MRQDHYLLSESDVDRIRELFESVHFTVQEFIESRKVQVAPWDEMEHPEFDNTMAIITELENETKRKPDSDF